MTSLPTNAKGPQGLIIVLNAALVLIPLIAFWQVGENGFINYDDDIYVTGNAMVRQGLSTGGIAWAFTTGHASNWHPLTWLSHMLDCQLFGLVPRGHHLVSLLLHLVNTLLLFALLRRLLGAVLTSAAIALLFAIHPLHVESVAWVAERKDVLSAFFWLSAMLAYHGYAAAPGRRRYLLVTMLFLCGLMAKPMLVTLPLLFLLLDWWPLQRLQHHGWRPLVLEKIPWLLMSLASSLITIIVQTKGDSVASLTQAPLGERLANAPVAAATYLARMVWPVDLAAFYPFAVPAPWQAVVSIALLVFVTMAAIRWRQAHPYLLSGWLLYIITLLPVIGLVQVGEQAMADRYTYLPLIGPFLMLVQSLARLGSSRQWRRALAAGGALAVIALSWLTWLQVGYWRNSLTLFSHAAAVTGKNYLAMNNIGMYYDEVGDQAKGDFYFRQALLLNPRFALAHYNLGVSREAAGDLAGAEALFREAVRLKPRLAEAHYNLGVVLVKTGRLREGVDRFAEAVRLEPEYASARHNLELGLKMLQQRR